MVFSGFREKSVTFTSARTGEVMLHIERHDDDVSVSGTSPSALLAISIDGEDLHLTGIIRDRVGDVLRFFVDGREEHVAAAHIKIGGLATG